MSLGQRERNIIDCQTEQNISNGQACKTCQTDRDKRICKKDWHRKEYARLTYRLTDETQIKILPTTDRDKAICKTD